MLSIYRTLSQGTIKENALGYIKQTTWVVKYTVILIEMGYFNLILTSFFDFVYNRTIKKPRKTR